MPALGPSAPGRLVRLGEVERGKGRAPSGAAHAVPGLWSIGAGVRSVLRPGDRYGPWSSSASLLDGLGATLSVRGRGSAYCPRMRTSRRLGRPRSAVAVVGKGGGHVQLSLSWLAFGFAGALPQNLDAPSASA